MLGRLVGILSAVAVAAAAAAPVGAHYNSKRQLDTDLVVLKGKVVSFDNGVPSLEDGAEIVLETRNTNTRGEPQPGMKTYWRVSADAKALKAAGITRAKLTEGTPVTVLGYRVENDLCNGSEPSCWFAGRQLALENGCITFIGRSPAFGRRSMTWGANIPTDGLDKPDRSHC